MTYSGQSPIFSPPNVTPAGFRAALLGHRSPAAAESQAIYAALVSAGIDPAIALGQFAAESTFGTRGYAGATKNWGNIAMATPRDQGVKRAAKIAGHWSRAFGARPYAPGNGYAYASFPSWERGAQAYAALMRTYRLRGWATSVAVMAGRWLGMVDASRSGYVRNILSVANGVAPKTVASAPVPASKLADLRRYIANLTRVTRPTAEQRAKLTEYRRRLRSFLDRNAS